MTIHRRYRRSTLSAEAVTALIVEVRGQRLLLDQDLAPLYGVTTGALNQAVRRNAGRFPPDFLLRLTPEEVANLISQSVISSWGGRRKPLLAFTEQGVAMLSSVLRSARAAQVNVAIMRAFVHLRRLLLSHAELARQIDELEQRVGRHDEQIAAVFEAIRQLLAPPSDPAKRIGFDQGS